MVETSSELQRLELVLGSIPDEGLMRVLEAEHKGRRDDYPIGSTWNTVIAGIVFGHDSVESLRRELLRNGELRQTCGFEVAKGEKAVPKPILGAFDDIFYTKKGEILCHYLSDKNMDDTELRSNRHFVGTRRASSRAQHAVPLHF